MQTRQLQYQAILATPFGALGICMKDQRLRSIDFLPEEQRMQCAVGRSTQRIIEALQDYLRDPKVPLTIEPQLEGTEFQHRVWRRLRQIPAGKTLTYGQLAQELDSSPRAVGNACRANPCPLVIPCHRVVGKQGLGGFAGKTSGPKLQLKIWLLTHEGVLPVSSAA